METTYLNAFYTTVKCNSISKAAKTLHLSQPGLSKQIQALENELGSVLLSRSNKGVELTTEGEIVYKYSKAILSMEENIYTDLTNLLEHHKQVTIGACRNLADYALPCSIHTFKKIHQDINAIVISNTSKQILQSIKNRELNIGLVQDVGEVEGIKRIPLLKDELILVCRGTKDVECIGVEEMCEIPLIIREKSSFMYQLLGHQLEKVNKDYEDLNVILQLDSNEALKTYLLSGEGYAFLPALTLRNEIHSQRLKKVPVQNFKVGFDYTLVYRHDYEFTKEEKIFVNFLTSKKRCFCY